MTGSFFEAFPAEQGASLRPLLAPDFTSSRLKTWHHDRLSLGTVHALGVWALDDVTVAGFHGHLYAGGERITERSILPYYVEDLAREGLGRIDEGLDLPERIVEEPSVVFVGWGRHIYGHVLLEMAPKIRIAAKALNQPPERLRFVLPTQTPDWFRQIVDLAGARQFVGWNPDRERLTLRRALVTTLPWDRALHPACGGFFNAMAPPTSKPSEALFVTRREARVTRSVRLLNRDEIEACAERAGLRIVGPESLAVKQQAHQFADARLVVGEFGSALINSVFCQAGAVVGAIGDRSQSLSAISALRNLRQSYFDPSGDPDDPLGYKVDASAFCRWLDILLRAADEPHTTQAPANVVGQSS